MRNFDFRAFVKKQRKEERLDREERIVKESYKKILLKERLSSTSRVGEMERVIESIMFDWSSGKDILAEAGANEESILDKVIGFGGKMLGTWEKGGGIWGRGEREERAKAEYQKMLEHSSSELTRKFIEHFDKSYPDFPSMKSQHKFGEAIADIYTYYDSLKHAVLTPEDVEGKPISAIQKAIDGGKIDVMLANHLIGDLREWLHLQLDYYVRSDYKHRMENKQPEDDDEVLEELFGFGKKRGWEAEAERQDAEDRGETPEEPEKLLSRTAGDTAVTKSLKSNKLPAILAAAGLGAWLIKILIEAGWFSKLFDQYVVQNPTPEGVREFGESIETVLTPQPGEGVTQMIGRVVYGDPTTFGSDIAPQKLFDAMVEKGIEPEHLAQLSENPADFMTAWKEAVASKASTLGEMFPGDLIDIGDAASTFSPDVGSTIGDMAAYIEKAELSREQLDQIAKRAGEIGNALAGQDILTPTNLSGANILDIIKNGDPATNMVAGTRTGSASRSLLSFNLAMQEAAGAIDAAEITSNATPGGPGALGLKLGNSVTSLITRTIGKEIAKGTGKAAGVGTVAGTLGISAPAAAWVLGVLGISGIASAAGVKALRLKGQADSRAEDLQTLRTALHDLKGDPLPTVGPPGETGGETGGEPPVVPPVVPPVTPKTDDPLTGFKVGDFVIVKNKKGREILTTIAEMPQSLQEKNQWEDEGIIFITGGDWSIPLGGRRGYNSKGQKWIAIKDGEVQIRKADTEDATRAVETDSKVADKMGVDKLEHEAEFEDDEQQNVEYSKFQERLANDKRIWDDKGRSTISPEEMTKIFQAIKNEAAKLGHFQRFIMHGTGQGAGAKVDGDFLPDASKTTDSLDEAKVKDLELRGIVNLLRKEIVPKLETSISKEIVMAAIIDSLIKANLLLTHKGSRLKKSPEFKEAGKDSAPRKRSLLNQPSSKKFSKNKMFKEILRRINERLKKANKKPITEKQLAKYLKARLILNENKK